MKAVNAVKFVFPGISENERTARAVVSAFLVQLDPTVEELADIRTAVSEAVTNAIIHGYENLSGYSRHGESIPAYSIVHPGKVRMRCVLEGDMLSIEITDQGKGIEDLKKAMEPLFTTAPEEERAGLGFTIMESFMDKLQVKSKPGQGVTVTMRKKLGNPICREK